MKKVNQFCWRIGRKTDLIYSPDDIGYYLQQGDKTSQIFLTVAIAVDFYKNQSDKIEWSE